MSQDMSMVPAVNQCKSNRETETYFQQLIRFVTKKVFDFLYKGQLSRKSVYSTLEVAAKKWSELYEAAIELFYKLFSPFCSNFLLFLLSCFVQCILIRNATAQIILCESVVVYNFGLNTGKPKTCMMSGSTAIAAVGSRTETNTAVGALWMFGNKKIEYLPENIDVTLPNLIGINAANCALKAISKANFKNLLKLKNLMLEDNRIETIEGATFQDLKALITLNLGMEVVEELL